MLGISHLFLLLRLLEVLIHIAGRKVRAEPPGSDVLIIRKPPKHEHEHSVSESTLINSRNQHRHNSIHSNLLHYAHMADVFQQHAHLF